MVTMDAFTKMVAVAMVVFAAGAAAIWRIFDKLDRLDSRLDRLGTDVNRLGTDVKRLGTDVNRLDTDVKQVKATVNFINTSTTAYFRRADFAVAALSMCTVPIYANGTPGMLTLLNTSWALNRGLFCNSFLNSS